MATGPLDPSCSSCPNAQHSGGPQRMPSLGFSSSQAASGIQFPPSPTLESVPDRFLSSFAIIIQVYIFKKAAGHRAVCRRQRTPFLPRTTLSHCFLVGPGTPGQLPKPGTPCLPSVGVERLVFPRGDSHCPLCTAPHPHLLGIASRFRTRERRILLKGP